MKGFCPSFVTVHGAQAEEGRGRRAATRRCRRCPSPQLPQIGQTYNIIVTGVGGTGVVTIGGILGMAAHLEGKGVGVIDMAGLAQKGGAVYSHIRIAERPEDIHAIRVAAGGADLVLGGDIVVAGNKKVLAAVKPGTRDDRQHRRVPARRLHPQRRLLAADRAAQARDHRRRPGASTRHFVDATRLATALLGNSIGANIFLLGYAYQLGALPLSADAIEQAIELNGEAVAMNRRRSAGAAAPRSIRAAVEALAKPAAENRDENRTLSQTFEEMVERRVAFLTAYQNAAYAARYRALVEKVQAAEAAKAPGQCGLAEAVARYLFKLMAYKDEYEVARLYTDGTFLQAGRERARRRQPALRIPSRAAAARATTNPATGEPRKMSFGPWMMTRVRRAGAAEVPARHAVRHLRLFGTSAGPSAS